MNPPPAAQNPHKDNPLLGMGCAVAAFFFLAVMNVFAKKLAVNHSVIEIAFYRNIIAIWPFLFLIFVMGKKEIMTIKTSPRTIVVRSVLGTISLALTFAAFAMMPMADATAFLFTSSLLIPAAGFFFLGEKVGAQRWGAVLVGFMGVLVMLQPDGNVNLAGAGVALAAACMHATLQIILRKLGKTENPETVTFYFVFIGMFVSLIPMPLVYVQPRWEEAPLIIGLGITGVMGQFFISTAYKYAPAAIVTVFNYSGIIWATLFGWYFWDEFPTHTILTGAAIVIASNIFIVWRENRLAKRNQAVVQEADPL